MLVLDKPLAGEVRARPKAEQGNANDVRAPMPGLVVRVNVAEGEVTRAGQKLLSLEAMKMETTVYAERSAGVAEVLVHAGTQVETGDLLIRLAASRRFKLPTWTSRRC